MSHVLAPCNLRYFTDKGHSIHGVVHVGANDGQEIEDYLHMGYGPVVAFEPLRAPCLELRRHYGMNPLVVSINMGLGDKTEDVEIHVPTHLHAPTDDHQSSSLLLPNRDSSYGWGERYKQMRTETVWISRFDEWAKATGFLIRNFNALVIDVEGFELRVLRGFGDYLDGFNFLIVECSAEPIYDGQAPASEVIRFLESRGFHQDSPTLPHGDVLFIWKGL